jgi:gliding-associated putative ABC transporter substrate-binding component GldG
MASKKLANSTQSIIFVLIILGFVAVINYLSTKYFKRVDLTETKEYSISPASKRMLRDLDDLINIKVYFSENLPPHLKTLESGVRDLLTEFKAYAGSNLKISWEDPSKSEEVKSKVRALGIPEVQLQTFEKDKAQVMNGFMGIAILYADKKEVLPVVQDLRNLEYDLAQAIMKVFRTETPKVGVLKTDTMPYLPPNIQRQMNVTDKTEEKYKPIFDNLRENYDVVTVDISDGQKIDPEIRTLIVPGGGPKSFTERDLFEIDQYFMQGGNLIVLADAMAVNFQYGVNASAQSPRILKLLEHYGVKVEQSLVLDASCGQVQIPQQFGMFRMNVAVDYPYFVRVGQKGFNDENPAVSGLGEMILPWTSPLTVLVDQGDSAADSLAPGATVLARSSEKSWVENSGFNLNPQQNWQQVIAGKQEQLERQSLAVHVGGAFESYFAGKSVPPAKEPDSADALGQINLSAEDASRDIIPASSRATNHLIVAGDSDFLSAQNAAPGNIAFLLNVVDWLTLDENLIGIRSRALVDRTIQSDKLEAGSSYANVIRFLNIFGMPVLVIAFGLVIFLRRREKVDSRPAAVAEKGDKGGAGNGNTDSSKEVTHA